MIDLVVHVTFHLNRVTAEVRSLKYPSCASQMAQDRWIAWETPSTSSYIKSVLLFELSPDAIENYHPDTVSICCNLFGTPYTVREIFKGIRACPSNNHKQSMTSDAW